MYQIPFDSYISVYYDLGLIVTDVLKKLCASDGVCRKCICKDDVTNALLAPIGHWLDRSVSSVIPTYFIQMPFII